MTLTLPRDTHFHHPLEKVVFHFWQPEKSISQEHTHEYCELFLVESGSGVHVINEKPCLLTAGTLCYLNRQDYHLFEEMKDLNQVNLLYLGRDQFNVIKGIDHLLPGPEETNVWQIDTRIIRKVIDKLSTHHEGEFTNKYLAESHKEMMFLEALHTLSEWRYKTHDFHSCDDRISQIIIWMKSHLDQPLDIDGLCRMFAISRRSLQRGFTDYAGVSPQQYLSTTKLLQARYYLQFCQMNVSQVAQRCGFSDISYFSRLFRKHFGISPNQCQG
ncbi:helix-turn-helix domain-containing protein [Martelella alba]|uniref:Helix-turn-helix domain-containing protein n=1 Tax=Martelella alba TaxID=2590451 RepID=A0ABY2SMC4_9HYPH|nr:helix-turn-helix domain-containing protein [Martelella alba]TKI06062.1 helix-turn-helix domain-containing protein [Martelella alba]